MSETLHSEPYVEGFHRNYAENANNLLARFAVYELAVPKVDIPEKAIGVLQKIGALTTESTVMDVGTGPGTLFEVLYDKYGHRGEFIGIDPNIRQFSHLANPLFEVSPEAWQDMNSRGLPVPINPSALLEFQAKNAVQPFKISEKLTLQEGVATDLGAFPDNSVNVLFSMFVLYHVPVEERPQAYAEFKRVMRPRGIFVAATSGQGNKPMHRVFEKEIAELMGISPPPLMNARFTSEIAEAELPQFFKRVYKYDHRATVDINKPEEIEVLLGSIRSLRDQFNPIPDYDEFEDALHAVVMPHFARRRKAKTIFKEYIHRSLFICSPRRLELPDKIGFTPLTSE